MLKKLFSNRGFALIELSVVMLIMALIAAAAVPNLNKSHAGYNLHVAALRLQQEIRTLGQESLKRETAGYRITFNINRDYYVIYGPDGAGKVTVPPGIDIVGTNFDDATNYIFDRINFSARGKPTRGGHVTLKSTLTGDFKYVIVAAVTGRTRVSDNPPGSANDI